MQGWRIAGEWLFPVPGSQPQGAELTAHKTGEPQPKLPEGTGDMVGTHGLWAAQGTRDRGFGSTSVMCNAIKCLILFIWAISSITGSSCTPLSPPCVVFHGV